MEENIIKKNKNNFFVLYADCLLVKGYTRTMICDMSNREMFFIDNSYYQLIQELKSKKISEILKELDEEEHLEFQNFIDQMMENNLATFVENPDLFPPIEEEWDSPFKISNAIIDIRHKKHNYREIFKQLNDDLLCPYVQIRSYVELLPDELRSILSEYDKISEFRHIEIILKYPDIFDRNGYLDVLSDFKMISLTFHSSGARIREYKNFHPRVSFLKQPFNSCESCGVINKKSMCLSSLSNFFENKNHNSCLNRKISIDESGKIKNCPSMKKDYGDYDNSSLEKVLTDKDFTKLWHINKDQIKVCKDCEFRYICSDCRSYLTDPTDMYSKPLKCNYNPYSGKWEDVLH